MTRCEGQADVYTRKSSFSAQCTGTAGHDGPHVWDVDGESRWLSRDMTPTLTDDVPRQIRMVVATAEGRVLFQRMWTLSEWTPGRLRAAIDGFEKTTSFDDSVEWQERGERSACAAMESFISQLVARERRLAEAEQARKKRAGQRKRTKGRK